MMDITTSGRIGVSALSKTIKFLRNKDPWVEHDIRLGNIYLNQGDTYRNLGDHNRAVGKYDNAIAHFNSAFEKECTRLRTSKNRFTQIGEGELKSYRGKISSHIELGEYNHAKQCFRGLGESYDMPHKRYLASDNELRNDFKSLFNTLQAKSRTNIGKAYWLHE